MGAWGERSPAHEEYRGWLIYAPVKWGLWAAQKDPESYYCPIGGMSLEEIKRKIDKEED